MMWLSISLGSSVQSFLLFSLSSECPEYYASIAVSLNKMMFLLVGVWLVAFLWSSSLICLTAKLHQQLYQHAERCCRNKGLGKRDSICQHQQLKKCLSKDLV